MRSPPLTLLSLLLAPMLAVAAQPKPAFDVSEASVGELQARMREGKLDSQALTRAYLPDASLRELVASTSEALR